MAPNSLVSSAWYWLHITLLESRILKKLLDFLKIYSLLDKGQESRILKKLLDFLKIYSLLDKGHFFFFFTF